MEQPRTMVPRKSYKFFVVHENVDVVAMLVAMVPVPVSSTGLFDNGVYRHSFCLLLAAIGGLASLDGRRVLPGGFSRRQELRRDLNRIPKKSRFPPLAPKWGDHPGWPCLSSHPRLRWPLNRAMIFGEDLIKVPAYLFRGPDFIGSRSRVVSQGY
jgi:hypothetical protein